MAPSWAFPAWPLAGKRGIFVNLSRTRRFFYVGDIVDDERGFENRVGKPLLLRDSDDDPVLANRIVSKLEPTPQKGTGSPGSRRSACWKLFPPDRSPAFPPNPVRRAADFLFPHGHLVQRQPG